MQLTVFFLSNILLFYVVWLNCKHKIILDVSEEQKDKIEKLEKEIRKLRGALKDAMKTNSSLTIQLQQLRRLGLFYLLFIFKAISECILNISYFKFLKFFNFVSGNNSFPNLHRVIKDIARLLQILQ